MRRPWVRGLGVSVLAGALGASACGSPPAAGIGPVAGTTMMCEPPAMELEGRFLAALGNATRYALADGRLSLDAGGSPPAGRLVFERR